MGKKKTREDQFFPVAKVPKLSPSRKPAENPSVIKKIIQGAIQGAYQKETPSDFDIKYKGISKPLVSQEEIEFVTHLIESFEPADAIEAALASQFAITYIRGLKEARSMNITSDDSMFRFFEFSHQVLEVLQKYRMKGAQNINVQYNHNQAQVNNYNLSEKDNSQTIIDDC